MTIFLQDHNYGAPMPYSQPSCQFQGNNGSSIENDDLPAKLVPLFVAQSAEKCDNLSSTSPVQILPQHTLSSPQPGRVPEKPKLSKKQKEVAANNSCSHYDDTDISKPKAGATRCVCDLSHDDGFMIQCDCCTAWQHVVCFSLSKERLKSKEFCCEVCEPRNVDKNRAKAIQERKIKKEEEKKMKEREKRQRKKNNKLKAMEGVQTSDHQNNESAVPCVSREDRKLQAIMKQIEELEKKKSRDKSTEPTRKDEGARAPQQVPAIKKEEDSEKKTVVKKPKVKSAEKVLKKSTKFVNKKTGKLEKGSLKKRYRAPSVVSTTSSSSEEEAPRRVSSKNKHRSSLKTPESGSVPSGLCHSSKTGTGKKRWLKPEETMITPPEPTPTATQPDFSDIRPDFSAPPPVMFPQSLFENRLPDAVPSHVASPPVSPEPVAAPIKKRFMRAESASTPVTETPVITPVISAPPMMPPISASDVFVSPPPPTTEVIPTTEIETPVAKCEPEPVVEPPAKRRVSLKEYKQRIKEPSVSIEKKVQEEPKPEEQATTPVVSTTPSIISPAPVLSNSVFDKAKISIDADEDLLLNMPLPSDREISGLPPITLNSIPSNPPLDAAASSNQQKQPESPQRSRSRHQSHRKHRHIKPSSDLKVIIPTKAEREAKIRRVNQWLEEVVKVNEDEEPPALQADEQLQPQQSTFENETEKISEEIRESPNHAGTPSDSSPTSANYSEHSSPNVKAETSI